MTGNWLGVREDMETTRLGKFQLIDALHTEHDRLIASVMRLSPEQQVEPGVVGFWSVKDVVAHLIYWTRYPVREIQAALDGRPFDSLDFNDEDALNAAVIAPYARSSMDAVLLEFEQAFGETVQFVERLAEQAFEPGGEIECRLEDSMAGAFGNNTYDHYALHREQIEAWINKSSG